MKKQIFGKRQRADSRRSRDKSSPSRLLGADGSFVVGDFRYVGKETDHKWEEGDDISVLEFKTTEYGRTRRVVASEEVKSDIKRIGIKKCAAKVDSRIHAHLHREITSRIACKTQLVQ